MSTASTALPAPASSLPAVLAASSGRGERRLQVGVYVLFALVAVLLVRHPPSDAPLGEILVLVLSIPTFFAWMGWFSRLMLLRAQGQAMRVPGLARASDRALLAMVGATVLLPALLIATTGSSPVWSASALGGVAACGLLLALLPRGLVGLLGFLPMLVGAIGGDTVAVMVDWHAAMPRVAAVPVLLAAWRWQRIAVDIERWNEPDWRQPLVFAMGRRAFAFGGDLADARVQEGMLPRWWRKGADLGAMRPGSIPTMRTLLGGVFTPVGWKQTLASLAAYGLILVVLLRYLEDEGDSRLQLMLFMGLFVGGMLLTFPFAARLQALQRRHGGELAELSLLPGWGTPAQARDTLARTVCHVFGRIAAIVVLAMAGIAALTGQPPVVLLAVVASLALVVLGVVAWLRPLAGKPWQLGPWSAAGLLLVGPSLLGCTVVAFGGHKLLLPTLGAWSVLLVGALWPATRLWRAFQRRPQPFLME